MKHNSNFIITIILILFPAAAIIKSNRRKSKSPERSEQSGYGSRPSSASPPSKIFHRHVQRNQPQYQYQFPQPEEYNPRVHSLHLVDLDIPSEAIPIKQRKPS